MNPEFSFPETNKLRIGIYSDVHANIEALDAVLEALDKEKVDRTLCLGDLVGYGPDPNACVEKVMRNADEILAGNHDQAAVGLVPLSDFNDNAAEALEWTCRILSDQAAEFLCRLPLTVREGELTAVHATPDAPQEWNYILKKSDIIRNLTVQETPLCFFGHSHIPMAFIRDGEGHIIIREANDIRFQKGWKYLVNVGSVGQPRDGDPRAAYGILDTEADTFQLKRQTYPVDRVQKKMIDENLPEALIQRLAVGQ